MTLKQRKIAFIGGGHITNIIIENLTKTQTVRPEQLIVSDPDKERLETLQSTYGIDTAKDNQDAAGKGDFVFINVLPQVVDEVIREFEQSTILTNKLLVTLAAGIPMKKYSVIGKKLPVVRALPNPPSQIGWGMIALTFNSYVTKSQQTDIITLFSSLGKYLILKEECINAVTALSNPTLVYMFFQALIDAGVRSGIDHETSTKIVYQSIVGAMEVWNNRKVAPYELINEAATPGGISVESLFVLDKYAFRAAINEAVYNATLKAGKFS